MRRALFLAAIATGACSNNSNVYSYPCSGPTSFEVYHSSAPVSAIPLCTDETDAGNEQIISIDGAAGFPFAGAPHLSHAGFEQCAAICSTATSPIPCCQSQWEPQTIVCAPACQ